MILGNTHIEMLFKLLIILYLSIASFNDIKTYGISPKLCSVFFAAFILLKLITNNNLLKTLLDLALGIIPGLATTLLAHLTDENIGYGDGLLIISLGIAMGFKNTFFVCCIAFVLSGMVALILIFRKKSGKQTLPFIPFIFISYIILLTI